MIGAVLASLVASQCSGAACPDPCTNCTWQPVSGANGSVDEVRTLFRSIAQRQGPGDLPEIDAVETGPSRTPTAAEFPCRLLPAIGATESSILQFCEASGLTVISFDCGFGIMQVTSGASSYPGIESRADINVAAGADILAQKWNGDGNFGGRFGDSDPSFVESWYFAVWAYNGFVYRNNPNNPSFPANRPPFHGPSSLSRGSYPYQELVWGYLEFPLVKSGEAVWEGLAVTYPDRKSIPNQEGLFSEDVALPQPAHPDPCVAVCPAEGCPPTELRTLILDDADANFQINGEVQEHQVGGFRDRFLSAALAPSGAPTVTARYEGVAPSTGLFDLGAYIPLDPATAEDVRITVRALGSSTSFSLNQNVSGGFFQGVGEIVLGEGRPVVVEITNDSSDTNPEHRVGMDALRFQWRAGATLPPGEGEGEGEPVGEGEEEGDGKRPARIAIPRPASGCGCDSTSNTQGFSLTVIGLAVVTWGQRRRRR